MNTLFEIPEFVVAALALLSCVGLGMKAWKYKDLSFLGDIIPRFYIAVIFITFGIYYNNVEPTLRGYWLRYGLTALFSTEIIRDLIKMSVAIRSKKEHNEKHAN